MNSGFKITTILAKESNHNNPPITNQIMFAPVILLFFSPLSDPQA